jgi:hypothetical protein
MSRSWCSCRTRRRIAGGSYEGRYRNLDGSPRCRRSESPTARIGLHHGPGADLQRAYREEPVALALRISADFMVAVKDLSR